ncbi:MAG: MotA/TolQ/ExbB proton channel family protein [Bacteriovoracaceae bacterium]|nr:MotA/TolQ/ExbB proton channel family protein [Bacteriovoracaceae bacterium]
MKNLKNVTLSAGISLGIIGLGMVGLKSSPVDSAFHRIMLLIGGDFLGGGYIQALTYMAFFLALFETQKKIRKVHRERRAFGMNVIPTNEKNVFLPNDINNLKFKLVELARKENFILIDLLKKTCTKFRSADSMGELMDIVSIQVEIYQDKAESDQSVIRYLVWVIPSLGFIGTVIGLALSLRIANSGDMNAITTALGVAFDTTLVSLVLSIIIMWYLHELQEKYDKLHSDLKEFVIENFINKIENH